MNAHNVINYFAKLNMLIYTFNGRQLQDNYCKFSVYDIFRFLSYMNLAVSLATPTMFSLYIAFGLYGIFLSMYMSCAILIYIRFYGMY